MDRSTLAGQFRFVREFDGELIILDDRHDVAHRLDAEAAAVWRACDGRSDAAAIARSTGSTPQRVRELIDALDERGLMAGPGETRRSMLRKAALTGAALAAAPAITSVLVPSPAQAFDSQHTGGQADESSPPQGGQSPPESKLASAAEDPALQGSSAPPSPASSARPTRPARPAARPGGGRQTAPTGPQRAPRGAAPGAAGAEPADAAAGAVRPLPRGTLPFTGTSVFAMAATGTGMIVAGAAARAAAGPAEPAP